MISCFTNLNSNAFIVSCTTHPGPQRLFTTVLCAHKARCTCSKSLPSPELRITDDANVNVGLCRGREKHIVWCGISNLIVNLMIYTHTFCALSYNGFVIDTTINHHTKTRPSQVIYKRNDKAPHGVCDFLAFPSERANSADLLWFLGC